MHRLLVIAMGEATEALLHNIYEESRITPTSKVMGHSTPRIGSGGAAQGDPNQSSSARSTTATSASFACDGHGGGG